MVHIYYLYSYKTHTENITKAVNKVSYKNEKFIHDFVFPTREIFSMWQWLFVFEHKKKKKKKIKLLKKSSFPVCKLYCWCRAVLNKQIRMFIYWSPYVMKHLISQSYGFFWNRFLLNWSKVFSAFNFVSVWLCF